MSAPGPFSSAHPFSSAFLKAWVDQAGAFQEMFSRLLDQSITAMPPGMPPPLLAPWKNFVDGMGMGGFNPEQMFPGAPALGLSREYQETAARLLDLSKQFQQRYAEFAQQNATIMQDAFHVLKKRFDEAPPHGKTPADLYDAWIDCAEGTYAQAAHSERFARLLAELCNISSAFKVERGKLTEQIARHLDLPSRAEVDTLHHQVRTLQLAMRAAAPSSGASGAAASGSAASGAGASGHAAAGPAKASKSSRKPRKRAKK
ncbi:MAG TPA: poly(R)-hydroxyalkanoic acid synthase subunit PhaE [Steroidobacteraceae bacterium]|nr:poly(R)-hydroxyalkanoic acid synthase subunit PhaE [Steroidobacteraceae bacterium]